MVTPQIIGAPPPSRWATARRTAVGTAVAVAVALVAATLGVSAPAAAQTQPFTDTSQDAYYSEAVGALAGGGVFDGTECAPGMLCPGEPIDRKTMAVWTVRALDGEDPAPIPNSRFSDVAADSFHGPFIERMAELGVTTGCGDRTGFCPDNTVTRNQMAVFLTRAFELDPGPAPGFSDVAPDAWYYNHVAALAASGITTGCGDGTAFCPHRQTTRAQMAAFLARATGLVELPTTTPDSASPYPVTVILPNTIVTIDDSGRRSVVTEDFGLRASVSPDGRRIAYATDTTLYVTNRDGTDARPVTEASFSGPYTYSGPGLTWSPDSSRIAYFANPDDNSWSELFVTNADGTETHRVAGRRNISYSSIKWSPDGSRIAYREYLDPPSYDYRLFVANADGTDTQRLAELAPSAYERPYFEWSPDSRHIAYVARTDTALFVANVDGSDTIRIAENLRWESRAVHLVQWSPDSRRIVYETSLGIFVADADGIDTPQRVGSSDSFYDADLFYDEGLGGRWYMWSPDGSHIAHATGLLGTIVVFAADGSYDHYLQELCGAGGQETGFKAAWSPDSARIAYADNSFAIFHLGGADGQCSRFPFLTGRGYASLEWSANGGHILLSGYPSSVVVRSDAPALLERNSEGWFTEESLRRYGESMRSFEGGGVFSPDSTRIAFIGSDGVTVMDISNGETSVVLDCSDIAATNSDGRVYECRSNRLRWTQSGLHG